MRWLAVAALAWLTACGGSDPATDASSDPGGGPTPGVPAPGDPAPGAPASASFVVMPASTQLAVDGQASLFALQPPGALAWSSSDSAVASVDASGQVTAHARGNAVITATSGSATASAALKVYQADGPGADAKSTALIAQALASGAITAEQALMYRVYAQFGDARLPAAYAGAPAAAPDHLLLREVASKLPTLSQAAQDLLHPFFVPPLYAQSWYAEQLAALDPQAAAKGSKTQSARSGPQTVLANCDFAAHPLFIGKVSTDHFNGLLHRAALLRQQPSPRRARRRGGRGGLGRRDRPARARAAEGQRRALQRRRRQGRHLPGARPRRARRRPDRALFGNLRQHAELHPAQPVQRADVRGLPLASGEAHDIVKSVVGHEFMHVLQFAMARTTSCDDMRWFDEATAEWAMDFSMVRP